MSFVAYAIAGAFASALAGTLAKVGLDRAPPALATAITSMVVATSTFAFAGARGDLGAAAALDRRSWAWLLLSGAATAAAYLLYFRALSRGDSARVQPLDRLSLVFAVVLAAVFLREKISAGLAVGVVLMASGAVVIAVSAR